MDALLSALIAFRQLLEAHWLSAIFILCTVTFIAATAALRWWLRRRWQRLLEDQFSDEESALDVLQPIGPQDQRALELIRQSRRAVWSQPEAELGLGLEALTARAVQIIRSIAAIYHPEIVDPEYQASLIEALQLIRRVAARLTRLANIPPFRFLGERKLSDYQRYYQVYRKINENPVMQTLKQHRHLYRVVRWAVNVKNLGNPLYWAGRELSREGYFFMLRWFHLTFISQVGREAIRLYSGRQFRKAEDRDGALICYRLFALTRQWGGPSGQEWSLLVDLVANQSVLEAEAKLQILSRWARGRIPRDLDGQVLTTAAGVKWYREGLQKLLGADDNGPPLRTRYIQQALADLELEATAATTAEETSS